MTRRFPHHSLGHSSVLPFCAVIKLPFFQAFNNFIIFFVLNISIDWTSISFPFFVSFFLFFSRNSVDRLKLPLWIEFIYFLGLIQWPLASVFAIEWSEKLQSKLINEQYFHMLTTFFFSLLCYFCCFYLSCDYNFLLLFIPFEIFFAMTEKQESDGEKKVNLQMETWFMRVVFDCGRRSLMEMGHTRAEKKITKLIMMY